MSTFIVTLTLNDSTTENFRFMYIDTMANTIARILECVDVDGIEIVNELTGEVMLYRTYNDYYVCSDWREIVSDARDAI